MAFDKNKPAGSTPLNQSDNQIRDNFTALEAALDQDHDFTTGGTQTGKHEMVTFKAVIESKPSLSTGEGALYTKSYNGKSELFYEDNNGSEFLVMVPVGTILPLLPGYFTDGSNGGYAYQLGNENTIDAINALLNTYGFYVCNGVSLNLPTSPIFNGADRYLPNLTDDRFLMGDTVAGGIGGSNSSAHTHTTGSFTLTSSHIPAHTHPISSDGSHTHTIYTRDGLPAPGTNLITQKSNVSDYTTVTLHEITAGSSGSHYHGGATGSSIGGGSAHNHGTTGAASASENRPAYLSCFYIMRVH